MNILVINSGSSSIKFQLLNLQKNQLLCKGLIERVGLETGIFNYKPENGEKIVEEFPIPNHKVGLEHAISIITDPKIGVIPSINEIHAVGHRVVHGGDKIKSSVLLNDETIKMIEDCIPLAPLHNPANLMGIEAVKELLPNVPQVGAFDTAFHSTMPAESFIYALPYEMYEKHGIRRFGFHGTSHQYVAMRAAEMLNLKFEEFSGITIHLGNGSSLTAVKDGKSVDTTLGYGTMCGVPMGTRAGDFDPAIIFHCLDELGMSKEEVHKMIYKESGLQGLSGETSDMRDVKKAAANGSEKAQIALDVLAHAIAKNVAGLATNLDKIDAIIFTAGIGENDIDLRKNVCKRLNVFGIKLDEDLNNVYGEDKLISTSDSSVKILVVPTNEEKMIAIDTEKLAN